MRETDDARALINMACSESVLPALACAASDHVARLCRAGNRIRAASCQQLNSLGFIESVVHDVGLVPDHRGREIYGSAVQYMIPALRGNSSVSKVGLWQNPKQLAAALHFIGTMGARPTSYLEIGVYSGWMAFLMAAWLSRLAGADAERFHGTAVDINEDYSLPTRRMLRESNVQFVLRPDLSLSPRHQYDLCFIDGDHTYKGVRADYEAFAPHCGTVLFHDIVDTSNWRYDLRAIERGSKDPPGGIPLFWAQLRHRVHAARVHEFVEQNGNRLPAFGLGLLTANHRGTAEPDHPLARWTQQNITRGTRDMPLRAALRHHLCDRDNTSTASGPYDSTALVCASVWFCFSC